MSLCIFDALIIDNIIDILRFLSFHEIFQKNITATTSKSFYKASNILLKTIKTNNCMNHEYIDYENSPNTIVHTPLLFFKPCMRKTIRKQLFNIFEENCNESQLFISNPHTNTIMLVVAINSNKLLLLHKSIRGTNIEEIVFEKKIFF